VSAITTHILDLARGRPAADVHVRLERQERNGDWTELSRRATDGDGRIKDLLPPGDIEAGRYRLTFETAGYFEARGTTTFYPEVPVVFEIEDGAQHYHVPLLLSPFGYSTYRGS